VVFFYSLFRGRRNSIFWITKKRRQYDLFRRGITGNEEALFRSQMVG
jgi:hypothetical protein